MHTAMFPSFSPSSEVLPRLTLRLWLWLCLRYPNTANLGSLLKLKFGSQNRTQRPPVSPSCAKDLKGLEPSRSLGRGLEKADQWLARRRKRAVFMVTANSRILPERRPLSTTRLPAQVRALPLLSEGAKRRLWFFLEDEVCKSS